MKIGITVSFMFAGSKETGIVESLSKANGNYKIRTEDGYLHPVPKNELIKIK
tara:strand:+ start:1620 stop:1775 length:156 start_codon:yes stop_codon:yes gene_type:complete